MYHSRSKDWGRSRQGCSTRATSTDDAGIFFGGEAPVIEAIELTEAPGWTA